MFDILIRWSVHSDWKSEFVRLDIIELANDECNQISGHDRGLVELHCLFGGARHVGFRSNIHIAQAREVLFGNQRDRILGLQGRFVETRESPPSICRLHLSRSQNALAAICILVR